MSMTELQKEQIKKLPIGTLVRIEDEGVVKICGHYREGDYGFDYTSPNDDRDYPPCEGPNVFPSSGWGASSVSVSTEDYNQHIGKGGFNIGDIVMRSALGSPVYEVVGFKRDGGKVVLENVETGMIVTRLPSELEHYEEEAFKPLVVGDILETDYAFWMVTQVGANKLLIICLNNGNRMNEVHVSREQLAEKENIDDIISDEWEHVGNIRNVNFSKIFGGK